MAQRTGPAAGSTGRVWAIAGIVCGALTLVWTPIVFALLGIVLGFVGRVKGSEGLGNAAITISVALLALIFVVNAILGGLGALV